MRKIILLIHLSLDGFVSGPDKWDLGWISYDDELEKDAHSMHDIADAVIWGRVTYEGMANYWLTVPGNPDSTEAERNHAQWLEDSTKIVVSRSLDSIEWGDAKNTVLIKDNIAEEINKLKQQEGKDIWFLGSPTLAQTFMELNLIDEYRINVNPTLLGAGQRLFPDLGSRRSLKLVDLKRFKSGVVGLRYVLVRGEEGK